MRRHIRKIRPPAKVLDGPVLRGGRRRHVDAAPRRLGGARRHHVDEALQRLDGLRIRGLKFQEAPAPCEGALGDHRQLGLRQGAPRTGGEAQCAHPAAERLASLRARRGLPGAAAPAHRLLALSAASSGSLWRFVGERLLHRCHRRSGCRIVWNGHMMFRQRRRPRCSQRVALDPRVSRGRRTIAGSCSGSSG